MLQSRPTHRALRWPRPSAISGSGIDTIVQSSSSVSALKLRHACGYQILQFFDTYLAAVDDTNHTSDSSEHDAVGDQAKTWLML